MLVERNLRRLPIHGQSTVNRHPGAAVIPYRQVRTTGAGPSAFLGGGWSDGGDSSATATVLPFPLSGSSRPVQAVLPTQPAAKSAKRADQRSITGEEGYRQLMFENMLAAAWLGTLFTAGYYMLHALAAPSTFY
jgi:hypothetical protein